MPPKYSWPSSGLTESDMALLYWARESSAKRTPITKLIAAAVMGLRAVPIYDWTSLALRAFLEHSDSPGGRSETPGVASVASGYSGD
jgi:hypothetical protein